MQLMPSNSWTPHEYQQRAISLMLQQASVGLFLDPGLGKTSIVLAAFTILKKQKLVERMLLVVPIRPMYSTWPAEIAKWEEFSHLTYSIVHGDAEQREAALAQDADIYMINPEGLVWLLENYGDSIRDHVDVLCIDESSKFKATNTKRFKALRPYIPSFQRRWCLTGTPTPNGIMDLFGQIYILDQGASLGRYITHYRQKFFYQSGYGGYTWTPAPGAFESITELTAPLVLQLSAEDHLKMPARLFVERYIELTDEVKQVYKDVESEFLAELEQGTILAANTAVAGGKCRQIANGAVYIEGGEYAELHTAKLEALEELLEELGGAPVLVLYEYQHDADRLVRHFSNRGIVNISGVSARRADEITREFCNGHIPLLLGHPASMGHGLNLQGECHHVVWFGIPWNLEHYDQANARVYRQGQRADTVFVYHIVAKGTLDETVLGVLKDKDRTQQNILKALAARRSS